MSAPAALRDGALSAMLATRLPVETPSLLDRRSAWITHLPFASWLVAAARPHALAELGVFHGISFCAFAEEMQRQGIEGTCLGVDTFAGDAHAGSYGGSVLDRLRAHHDPRYGGFSRLMQATFDEAAATVAPGSLDLLHIDGLHTYDAVRHDFETWLPKMSPRGVMLFHDTQERGKDFGVWRFWAEVSSGRPAFEFHHGHVLGVLAVGDDTPGALRPLFDASETEAGEIRALFAALGERCWAEAPKPPRRRFRFWPWR